MARIRAIFRGLVQGVGFRYHVLTISRDFRVTGFVRNRPDGSVLCEAQGELREVEKFLDAVEGTAPGELERTERKELPDVKREAAFSVM